MTTTTDQVRISDDERAVARALVQAVAKDADGVVHADRLRNLNPVALGADLVDGVDPTDAQALTDRSVSLTPTPHPLLDATLLTIGANRIGRRTYAVGLGEASNVKVAAAFLDALPAGACYPTGYLDELRDDTRLQDHAQDRRKVAADLTSIVEDTPIGKAALKATAARFDDWHRLEWEHAAVLLSVSNNTLYARVCTQPGAELYVGDLRDRLGRLTDGGMLNLDLLTFDTARTRDPITLAGIDALALLDVATAAGWVTADLSGGVVSRPLGVDPTGDSADLPFASLRATARRSVIATRLPSVPGRAHLHVGKDAPQREALTAGATITHDGADTLVLTRPVTDLTDLAADAGADVHLDRQVADLAAMAAAEPAGRERLRGYQDLAVSRYHATSVGYLLGLSVGLGKTVVTLAGWQERVAELAERGIAWRGIAAVPASLRAQWGRETGEWAPDVRVFVVRSSSDVDRLDELADGDEPLLVVLSYSMVKRLEDWLTSRDWHDLCLDEALIMKNSSSDRARAMWRLRNHVADGETRTGVAGKAVALTGTPIDKSVDDLAKIVAWTRNDPELFGERKLSQQFPRLAQGEDTTAFSEVIGPCLLRRDRSEIAAELPKVETVPLLLTPHDAELKLAEGARRELKRFYDELDAKLAEKAEMNPDDPRFAEAQADLAKARGAVLGGISLARMAASDPHAVAASESAAASLLDAAGLIAPAVRKGGTKRTEIVDVVDAVVADGEAVLIFTDFSTVADNLASDLRARGVEVGVLSGGRGKAGERDVERFQRGDVDVLVLTSAGREGLNLQRCSVLVHYDLPWNPAEIVQRVGRAVRIGADASRPLQVIVPVLEGTVEQRVAAVLVPRALTAINALDGSRDTDLGETEMAIAMRGISGTAGAELEALDADASIFDIARAIIG